MTSKRRGFRPINLLFGMMMGTADIIPGVSGGTVALIVGIYERLVGSIRDVSAGIVRFATGARVEARARFAAADWGLVIPLGIGILTALVIGARVLEPVLEEYPVQSRALFFGLIAASVVVPWHRMTEHRPKHLATMAIALVAAFALVGFPPRDILDPALPIVFLAASVAICAMILPGVSGSFLLLVMGLYEATIRSLNDLDFAYIGVFALGAATGLGIFSRLLYYLLRSHHDMTMAALVGLMIGSLRALWPFQDESRRLLAPPDSSALLQVGLLAIAGFVVVLVLIRVGRSIEEREHERATAPR